MRYNFFLTLMMLLQSCGTYNIDKQGQNYSSSTIKNAIYSGLLCAVIGGALGRKYSPNDQSKNANMMVFGGASTVLCGGVSGYISHQEENEAENRYDAPTTDYDKSTINIETEY